MNRAEIDVSVVVVNYNVREFLEQALSSVYRAAADLEVEVFVVYNNSVDGSQELVLAQFPDATLISNSSNVGFGAANNMAIRDSSGRYLLILNPDTIVQEDTLATMVDFMDRHPDAGAVGCKIINPDGTFAPESRRAFPTPEVAFYRMSGLSRLFPGSPRFGRYNLTFLPQDEVSEVDALSGSCMMVRRTALSTRLTPQSAATLSGDDAAGMIPDRLFDEDFFMYGEDLDLCYRIQAAGWKIYYTPETQIIHYKGESTRKGDLRYVKLFYGAMLLFAEKHFRERSLLFRAAIRIAIMIRAAASALKNAARASVIPALDFGIVYAIVSGIAALRFDEPSTSLGPRFLLTIPIIYGLAAVIGIRLAGGYRRGRRRFRPVVTGVVGAFATTATLSFFVKAIAFSRFVILASVIPSLILLIAWRIAANRRRRTPARAVVVGAGLEAARLGKTIAAQLRPPFSIVGYVSDDDQTEEGLPVTRLGSVGQLRDIIRLRDIDEVIFATNGLQNTTAVNLMRTLRDLPVEFKTFVERGTHVIGKARVEDLSVPLISTKETLGAAGGGKIGRVASRIIASVALIAIACHRLMHGGVHRHDRARQYRTGLLRQVVSGEIDLIGWIPDDSFRPPAEWGVGPGAFSVTDAISLRKLGNDEIARAWHMYLDNRSMWLSLEIAVRGLRRTLEAPHE
ncbi:MAG: glycosyltransferase [Rhodothermales bacterium]|nr:glycosyltransferase [Rhodothermales bacterium]